MTKSIYVGNLPFSTDDEELKSLFTEYGDVNSANIIIDRHRNRSKGFGFVEMDDEAADKAIEALNGSDFGGRALKVSEARGTRRESDGAEA